MRFVLSDLLMTSATQNPEMVFNLGEMHSGINQLLIGKHQSRGFLIKSLLCTCIYSVLQGFERALRCSMVHCSDLMLDSCCAILTDACDPFANVTLQCPIVGSLMHYCATGTVEKCDIVF